MIGQDLQHDPRIYNFIYIFPIHWSFLEGGGANPFEMAQKDICMSSYYYISFFYVTYIKKT